MTDGVRLTAHKGPQETLGGLIERVRQQAREQLATLDTKAKERSKTKFTCPSCGQNAWAKPDAALICGTCEEPMETRD
jgi:hypothetical protein